MYLLDTSVLVSSLTIEDTTLRANEWLLDHETANLAISTWVLAELSAALAKKVRMNRLSEGDRTLALRHFEVTVFPAFGLLDVATVHFRRAAEIAQHYRSGIRAGDALHVAVAASDGRTLVTFDKTLASGAATLGYAVELIA